MTAQSQPVAQGAQQGLKAFTADLASLKSTEPTTDSLTSLGALLSPESLLATDPISALTDVDTTISNVLNTLSGSLSSWYGFLITPTLDNLNAAALSLPAYDLQLFTENLQAGNLLDALGLPVAGNTGLLPLEVIAGETGDLEQASAALKTGFDTISTDLTNLFAELSGS